MSHQIKEPWKPKNSCSSSCSSSFRLTVHHINLPHGSPSGLCSRQHVFSWPVFHQHLSSCPVEPKLHWGVHHLLLRCPCLYQWVPATRPAGRPRTRPPGSYHPWEAPPLQGLVRKRWSVASHLCHVAPQQQPLGHLRGREQEGRWLWCRHVQGYFWGRDIHSGSGSGFVWREFHRAFFWEYHRPQCLEHVSG